MAKRKPRVEFYWAPVTRAEASGISAMTVAGRRVIDHKVNWRLVGANGEIMCQCTQGFRDQFDALRSVAAVTGILSGAAGIVPGNYKVVAPGVKPKVDA